jgi:hypothetical protein
VEETVKVGRNDPCPCGSGKKYKKCCALKEDLPDFSLPEDVQTGTRLDAYMELMQAVMMYYHGLIEFDNDRRELKRAVKDFEKDFQPGTEQGICDSLFVSWHLFDLRFGKSGKTVCERFLDESTMKKLGEPAISLIRHMSDSYATFYEVTDISNERYRFLELGTGVTWDVNRINDPNVQDVIKGEIWYTRFVGPVDDAFEFSTPYVFAPDAKEEFSKAVDLQIGETRRTLGELIGFEKLFRESCKSSLPGWADYMLDSIEYLEDEMSDNEPVEPFMPALVNTDGEIMRFCKMVFKVLDEKETKIRLDSMKSFDYDKANKTWIWFKKGNKQVSSFSNTSLGTITIKRGKLVGETNSEERVEKLVKKLKKELQGLVSFEKIEVKDLDELPPPSERERKRIKAEHEELMKNPEVREASHQIAEDYYHKEWLMKPVPALDGLSPVEAVKSQNGKLKVEALLDDLDIMQSRDINNAFNIDINSLRKRLGIEVKTN